MGRAAQTRATMLVTTTDQGHTMEAWKHQKAAGANEGFAKRHYYAQCKVCGYTIHYWSDGYQLAREASCREEQDYAARRD